MAVIGFNSNLSAITSQRYLDRATRDLGATFTRLSSGQRINRASDDAAGLAVADALRNQGRLYAGAVRNLNDGISAINIATGTLSNQVSIVQRMIELAEQAASGTFSSTQRLTMEEEYYQLQQEFGRQGSTARFNGVSLLLGGRGSNPNSLRFQLGIDGTTNSQVALALSDTGVLSGAIRESTTYGFGVEAALGISYTFDQVMSGGSNMVARKTLVDSAGNAHTVYLTIDYDTTGNYYHLNLLEKNSDLGAEGEMMADGETAIGPASNYTVVSSSTFTVNSQTRRVNGDPTVSLNYYLNAIAGSGGQFASSGNFNVDLGGLTFLPATAASSMQIVYPGDDNVTSIDFTGIENVSRARSALKIAKARLAELDNIIGLFGASQSRLETSLGVLTAARENSLAAEGRIRDTDIASDSALLTAQQIKQQAATQALSLAARQPEIALQLLR